MFNNLPIRSVETDACLSNLSVRLATADDSNSILLSLFVISSWSSFVILSRRLRYPYNINRDR